MQTANPAYQSSGTWSLLGIESDQPIITDESFAENFTNETGVEDTIRVLKNITGLWLVQECKRTWDDEGERPLDYGEMTDRASEADRFWHSLILMMPGLLRPMVCHRVFVLT